MSNAQPSDDHFGLCPVCRQPGTHLNIHRDNLVACHDHKVCWKVGENLFSSWRDEDPEVWHANWKLLKDYNWVTPQYHPLVCAQCSRETLTGTAAWDAGWVERLQPDRIFFCPRCAPEFPEAVEQDIEF